MNEQRPAVRTGILVRTATALMARGAAAPTGVTHH
jgi:hypothetical protein